ncbi:MAG: hypothetical protein EP341_05630 [Sphingomonadales bacterium]|nr:MAG: hypothetical protein EP341_05630 [Sphingomonadales bacterium]
MRRSEITPTARSEQPGDGTRLYAMDKADKPKLGTNRGNAGKGRPKGSRNKTTLAAKHAIAKAAEDLGGAERLVAWAQEDPANERVFWGTIYPKLLPLDVTSGGDKITMPTEIILRAAGE